jgi:hypothetical protein
MSRRMTNAGAAVPSTSGRHGMKAIASAKEAEAHRRMLRMAEDDSPAAQSAASWAVQGGLGVHLCLRGLQSGAPPQPFRETNRPRFPSLDDRSGENSTRSAVFQQPARVPERGFGTPEVTHHPEHRSLKAPLISPWGISLRFTRLGCRLCRLIKRMHSGMPHLVPAPRSPGVGFLVVRFVSHPTGNA